MLIYVYIQNKQKKVSYQVGGSMVEGNRWVVLLASMSFINFLKVCLCLCVSPQYLVFDIYNYT